MASKERRLLKALDRVRSLAKKDELTIALTLGQLSESSLEALTSLLGSVDVVELHRDKEEKDREKTMKKPPTKEEFFISDISPRKK